MCLYTYHHYPVCGHIANWTMTSCKEYTNALRLLSRKGLSGHCNHIQTTHNLFVQGESDTCGQCDFEVRCAAFRRTHDASPSKTHREIEGLTSEVPIIELSGRMNVSISGKEEENHRPVSRQECCSCEFCGCFASPLGSGVSPNDKTPPANNVSDIPQYLDDSFYIPETPTHNGKEFEIEIMLQILPSEEGGNADLYKVLREASSAEDISPSWAQVGARRTRNSLHGVISIGIDRAAYPLERLDTRNPYATSFLDLSDESPIDVQAQYTYSRPINLSSSVYFGSEPEQTFIDWSDDSSYSDLESEVRNPNNLTFLDDDSDADDDLDGGCELPDKFDEGYASTFSPLIFPLVSGNVHMALPSVRDSAPVADRPATPILCPAPLRVTKGPQFLSLNSIIEDTFYEEALDENTLEFLHAKTYSTPGGSSQRPFVGIKEKVLGSLG